MPRRGSGLAQAVASTTLSLARTTQEPWACLARCPVSKEMVLPPASSTVVAYFMMGILSSGASPGRIAKAFTGWEAQANFNKNSGCGYTDTAATCTLRAWGNVTYECPVSE